MIARLHRLRWFFLAPPVLFAALEARADLQFFPTRLHLSDVKRVTSLTLRQKGDKPEKYRLSATFWRMGYDGRMDKVEKPSDVRPEERSLVKYIRFSPREFELAPGAEQVVQVMYSGPGGLPEGEYRAQLLIEPSFDPAPQGPDKEARAAKQIRLEVQTKLAFAIPVIFRRGKPTFEVRLEKGTLAEQKDGNAVVQVDMISQGNAFSYGELEAFAKVEGDEETSLGFVRGIAGYVTPRRVDIPVKLPKAKLAGKKVRVVFRSVAESANVTTAETELAPAP